jgi:hypothetical protein
MPIDRRITNGLAWAGAVIVIAIPAADIALRQFGPAANPQMAVVDTRPEPEPEAEAPSLPTPVAQRPANVEQPTTEPVADEEPVAIAEGPETVDPVTTANTSQQASGGDVVDSFVQSGRPMPSYISGGSDAAPAAQQPRPAIVAPPASIAAPAPASEDEPVESVATVSRTQQVAFPTPVSERPPSVQRPPVVAPPPLVIDRPSPVVIEPQGPIVTADDLEDWESGPLSEFLARRQGGVPAVAPDYDPDGFFLDDGPNRNGAQRFPRAYEGEYYPFE